MRSASVSMPVMVRKALSGAIVGAEVAQAQRMAGNGEGEVAEGLVEAQAVIGRLGLGQGRELVVLRPVEAAGIDDDAAHRVAVAGEELGRRMDDDVGAPFERPAEIGRGQRVVDDERDAGLVGDRGDRLDDR